MPLECMIQIQDLLANFDFLEILIFFFLYLVSNVTLTFCVQSLGKE